MSTRLPTSRRPAGRTARLARAAAALAAGTLAVALAGCGSAQAPDSDSGSGSGAAAGTSAVTACAASGLRVRLDSAAAGVAAGSSYVPLEFTNISGHACHLAGYPAVAFTSGAAGPQIGAAAALDHHVRAATVRLPAGGIAHAWLQVLDTANYPAGRCHPVTAAGLTVAAPGTASASFLAHPVPACRKVVAGSKILTIHPVQPGRARRGTAQ